MQSLLNDLCFLKYYLVICILWSARHNQINIVRLNMEDIFIYTHMVD